MLHGDTQLYSLSPHLRSHARNTTSAQVRYTCCHTTRSSHSHSRLRVAFCSERHVVKRRHGAFSCSRTRLVLAGDERQRGPGNTGTGSASSASGRAGSWNATNCTLNRSGRGGGRCATPPPPSSPDPSHSSRKARQQASITAPFKLVRLTSTRLIVGQRGVSPEIPNAPERWRGHDGSLQHGVLPNEGIAPPAITITNLSGKAS